MNFKTIGIVGLSALISISALAQDEISTIRPSVFSDVQVIKSTNDSGQLEIKIQGEVKYSNGCFVSDHKSKKVDFINGELHYQVYSSRTEEKICMKIYRPVFKTYLIDEILMDKGDISSIFVNGQKVY